MPYLNLDPNYFDHPKTRRLAVILGPMSEVLPLRLWAYCAKIHPRDGVMKGYSADEVNAILGWRKPPEAAINALVKVGYLRRTETGFSCVDWRQHQGHLDAFSRRGKMAAKARWDAYASSRRKHSNGPAPAVLTNHTNPTNDGAAFTPPTLDEVKAYCKDRGGIVDAQAWHDHYSAIGWMVGKSPMREWKASVRKWERSADAIKAREAADRKAEAEALKCQRPGCGLAGNWAKGMSLDGKTKLCAACIEEEAVRAEMAGAQ